MKKKWIFMLIMLLALTAPIFGLLYPFRHSQSEEGYSCILELWHIDLFEGGKNSRGDFLKSRAIEFQQKNKGVFILVRTVTEEELIDKLSKGRQPDIFSFSAGVGDSLLPYLAEYGGGDFRTDLKSGVLSSGKQYGIPWCMGGYTLIAFSDTLQSAGLSESDFAANPFNTKLEGKNRSIYTVGFAAYNNPLQALSKNNYTAEKPKETLTQGEAYNEFYGRRASVLLGTQRDLVRIENAAIAGRASPYTTLPLKGYTDLLTVLSLSKDSENFTAAESYMKYVLSDNVQNKLIDIGMFSVTGLKIYTERAYQLLEEALSHPLTVPSVFLSKEQLLDSRNTMTASSTSLKPNRGLKQLEITQIE